MLVPGHTIRRINNVLQSANSQPLPDACTVQAAIAVLDVLIQKENERVASDMRAAWKRDFKNFTGETWKPAKTLLKDPQLNANFSAHDMRNDWSQHWCPGDNFAQSAEANWKKFADEVAFGTPACELNLSLPSWENFSNAVSKASGTCGFDGWTSDEVHALGKNFQPLTKELYHLWCETSMLCATQEHIDPELNCLLWPWKVVGIPKKTPFDSRPISVASVLLRTWHSALLSICPCPPAGQWCGQPETSVIHATANFFAADPCHIAETDLSKAFDHLWPEVASTALTYLGAPRTVVKTVSHAWRGPRVCTVAGQMAPPISPCRGIPQGDPISPLALGASLGPWSKTVSQLDPLIKAWAYMDDRTIAVIQGGSKCLLQAALTFTRKFDQQVGFQINQEKTQVRSHDDPTTNGCVLEHLGIKYNPAEQNSPITPKDPTKVENAVARLAQCPGTIDVRGKLATAFIRPLQNWATPLFSSGSDKDAKALFRAIVHPKATWWCQARFWCQHIDLHPKFGVAIEGLCTSYRVLQFPGRRLTTAIMKRCADLHLNLLRCNGVTLEVQTSDHTLQCSQRPGHHTGDFLEAANLEATNGVFDSKMRHALRIRARKLVLREVQSSRLDSEGVDNIDLEIYSHRKWKLFIKSLSFPDKNVLTIWQSGAIWTPTRRFFRPNEQDARTACFWCDERQANAKHFFCHCPKFSDLRTQLQNQHDIPTEWWESQPRCTSKSGWLTFDSAPSIDARVQRSIAASTLGIHIANVVFAQKLCLMLWHQRNLQWTL